MNPSKQGASIAETTTQFGIPVDILKRYEARNIVNLYEWQEDILSFSVCSDRDLIYCGPSKAGKTIIAELLALKCIFENKKRVLFIVPFVAGVREKLKDFHNVLENYSEIKIEGYVGGYSPPTLDTDLIIATNEKAYSLICHFIKTDRLVDFGGIVFDDVHNIKNPERGPIIDIMITAIKYAAGINRNIKTRLILTADIMLPNVKYIAEWLNGQYFKTNFKPVAVKEHIVISSRETYRYENESIVSSTPLPRISLNIDDIILQLCLISIRDKKSVLIFCQSRCCAEKLAQQISTAICQIGSSQSEWGTVLRSEIKTNSIWNLLQQLNFGSGRLDQLLNGAVSFGVAFHHAGLTLEKRNVIENAFRNKVLKVIVATTTLCDSVNLPVCTVIISTPYFWGRPIDPLMYRQMVARAGRMDRNDISGECFLICKRENLGVAKEIMRAELGSLQSNLASADKLERYILDIIRSNIASTSKELISFFKHTLWAFLLHKNAVNNQDIILGAMKKALSNLQKRGEIEILKEDENVVKYKVTSNISTYIDSSRSRGLPCLSCSMNYDDISIDGEFSIERGENS